MTKSVNCFIALLAFLLTSCPEGTNVVSRNNASNTKFTPGFYADMESLKSHKEQWVNNRPENYSFHYSERVFGSYPTNIEADIFVSGGVVDLQRSLIQEIDFKISQDVSEEMWNEMCLGVVPDISLLSLDSLFERVEQHIVSEKNKYEQCPDEYYSRTSLTYSADYFYISTSQMKSASKSKTKEGVDGGGVGTRNIQISSFQLQ